MYRLSNQTEVRARTSRPALPLRARHRTAREARGPWTAEPPAVVRVVVESSEPVIGAGLAALVQAAPTLRLVEPAAGPDPGPAAGVDVRVRDASTPTPEHLDRPEPVVIVARELTDASVLDLLRAGARGLLLHASVGDLLEPAARSAARGGSFLDPALVPRLAAMADRGRRTEHPDELTVQERRVLRLVARDLSNREIAAALGLSVHTVKAHLRRGARKLGASDRYDAVARARSRGMLDGRSGPEPEESQA